MFGRKFLLFALAASLAQLSNAQDRTAAISAGPSGASIASPVLGYYWSQTDGLALIEGVPGAAHIGRSRPMSFVPSRVAFPPGHSYAWIEALDLVKGQGAMDAVLAGSDVLSFTQNGNAAALYFRSAGTIKIVTGLPDSQTVSAKLATPQADCGMGAVAIADDATTVLLGCNGNLYSGGTDRDWRPVLPGDAAALSFLPGGVQALVIMNGDPAVYRVSLATQGVEVIAQLPDGMSDPISLAVLSDGSLALAIDGDGNAAQIEFATSRTSLVKVAKGMRSVERGRDPSTFVLIPDGAGVPWVVEARAGHPSASFVPRIPTTPEVSQQ